MRYVSVFSVPDRSGYHSQVYSVECIGLYVPPIPILVWILLGTAVRIVYNEAVRIKISLAVFPTLARYNIVRSYYFYYKLPLQTLWDGRRKWLWY